ncbi:D-tagatose-bisphosphate aldolase, class II, non-catalytic subunit [Terracidiphilus gabretensis]|uniref:D-tagatose-bisphosphate aldolase, class II, non-catalytic subunit n=1 Tax=Terracidiphilus gabretensis TaxID=1577687 RepID=UPI00071BEDB2|nr:D-tagatose-bisphosphate aldolase, class II, non-catalytic subunit [Terracidiphilus gabretensis]
MSEILKALLKERKNPNAARGIYSVCTAHPLAIRAALRQAREDGSPVLLEATSNQVNQFGGYTGMRPGDFRQLVQRLAEEEQFSVEQIILGGDHLGPNPWRTKPAEEAMKLAEEMIAGYAAEGFTKLHLDASMACAGDPAALPPEIVAERSARLCAVAEAAAPNAGELLYVVGTEVPVPGGATEELDSLQVTSVEDAERTLAIHHEIFATHGLAIASQRVIAMVVQPGVEFNHDTVHDYVHEKTAALTKWLDAHEPLVFEAHSSDYQRPEAYRHLVNDGFAILKVGPAVTFAMREAFFALARIEDELLPEAERSNLPRVLEEAMLEAPANWKGHYHGTAAEQRLLRTFSYSDRLRYYWTVPAVQHAADKLIANLSARTIPETLLSAYLPVQYAAVRERKLKNEPLELVLHASQCALKPYARACFGV